MPFARNTPIRLQPYFGYRSATRLRLSARALRSGKARFTAGGRWQAMRTMIAQFASREVADLPIRLEIAREGQPHIMHEAITDDEGFVHFDVKIDDWSLPARPEWEVVALHWTDAGEHHSVEGQVLVPGDTTPLGVISDIDDTIIETGITGDIRAVLRNWKRVLAQMPDERIAVPGVDNFYGALGGALPNDSASDDVGKHMPAAMDRPFFYVSSSPWNLYSYLVAYMRLNALPLGPIALRDWGLNRATFGGGSHGAHKRRAIDRIMATYPQMRFALIGDDTQGDLAAYGAVVEEYGHQVAAVFIRSAGEALSPEEEAAVRIIEASGVPLWRGPDYATGAAFLEQTGLLHDGDAARIVQAKDAAGQDASAKAQAG